MSTNTKEVFGGKSFANLLKDIYDNSVKKKHQIDILINELRPLVQNVNEATVMVPLIKDYLEVGVRNDEQLVKMAGVFQKYAAAENRADLFGKGIGGVGILTDKEKEDLLKEVAGEILENGDLIKKEDRDIGKELDELKIKSNGIIQSGSGDN